MAKVQIGAVIGVEGAKEYKAQLDACAAATKNLASQTALVEASFKGQTKTVSDLARQKLALKGEIAGVGEKLATQRAELSKVVEAYKRGDENALKYKNQMIGLATEVNKTETTLYGLEQKLNDLPAEGFVGKLELIKENLENNNSKLKEWGKTLTDIGQKLTTSLTLPITAAVGASVKAASDWESALNGVRKTTDMTEDEISLLETGLRDSALQTTYTSTELANLAQIAGQLGVRGVDDILKFVNVVSDLGISTDLSAEEAASSLARIFNITEGGNLDNLEALGSVIVHLGNNMATTEPEIVAMANRMASAGHTAGLSTQEIFALSGALTSVGITAEAGGSTVGQVLTKIEKYFAEWVSTGTGGLERIAQISNMSAEEFADAWQNKPVKAFEAFVTGLGNLDGESENLTLILDELGMAGIRESNMLKALAAAQDEGTDTTKLFSNALKLADEAYKGINEDGEKFNALQKEANVRKNESATAFSNLKESIAQLGVEMGEVLLPAIVQFVQGLTNFFSTLSNMDEGTKKFVLTLLGIVAAIGPVLVAVGQLMQLWSNMTIITTTLGITNGALLLSIGKWVAIGALVVGAIALIVKAIQWCKEHSEDLMRAWEAIKEGFQVIWEVIKLAFQISIEWISDLMASMVEFGRNMITNIFNFVKNILTSAWNFLKTTFTNIKNFVTTTFNNLKTSISNTWNGIVTNVSNFVTKVGNAISTGFTNAKNKAVSIFTTMKTALWNVVSGIVSSAWGWGSDIVHGIANGISSAIGAVTNAVANIANTIWSYLHFSEPEKGLLSDFHTWMPDFMSGLAQGINDNLYLVDRAADNVANSLGMNGGTAYNYGGVVINLNVPQGANGYQLVDEIESALAQKTVRRKAVFG